jgi:hypothetical protein
MDLFFRVESRVTEAFIALDVERTPFTLRHLPCGENWQGRHANAPRIRWPFKCRRLGERETMIGAGRPSRSYFMGGCLNYFHWRCLLTWSFAHVRHYQLKHHIPPVGLTVDKYVRITSYKDFLEVNPQSIVALSPHSSRGWEIVRGARGSGGM